MAPDQKISELNAQVLVLGLAVRSLLRENPAAAQDLAQRLPELLMHDGPTRPTMTGEHVREMQLWLLRTCGTTRKDGPHPDRV